MTQPDDFDQLLASAMQSRPLPAPIPNLAQRVLADAQQRQATLALRQSRLATLHRRARWIDAFASFLISLVLIAAAAYPFLAPRLPAPSFPFAPDLTPSNLDQWNLDLIAASILLLSLLLLALDRSLSHSRPRLP